MGIGRSVVAMLAASGSAARAVRSTSWGGKCWRQESVAMLGDSPQGVLLPPSVTRQGTTLRLVFAPLPPWGVAAAAAARLCSRPPLHSTCRQLCPNRSPSHHHHAHLPHPSGQPHRLRALHTPFLAGGRATAARRGAAGVRRPRRASASTAFARKTMTSSINDIIDCPINGRVWRPDRRGAATSQRANHRVREVSPHPEAPHPAARWPRQPP